jgi:hypothetical protein
MRLYPERTPSLLHGIHVKLEKRTIKVMSESHVRSRHCRVWSGAAEVHLSWSQLLMQRQRNDKTHMQSSRSWAHLLHRKRVAVPVHSLAGKSSKLHCMVQNSTESRPNEKTENPRLTRLRLQMFAVYCFNPFYIHLWISKL